MNSIENLFAIFWICVAFFLINLTFAVTIYNVSTYKIEQEHKVEVNK